MVLLKRDISVKSFPIIVLLACVAGFATTASSRDVPSGYVLEYPALKASPMEGRYGTRVVRVQTQIDLSSGQAEFVFPGSSTSYPIKLVFDKATSTVTFLRSLRDEGGWADGDLRSAMTYQSYDDLGLSSGPDKRAVRLYFSAHFLWVEVSGGPTNEVNARNALFFVGPPKAEVEGYIASGAEVLNYDRLKSQVALMCADAARWRKCKDLDTSLLLTILEQ